MRTTRTSGRILVAEDSALLRRVLGDVLGREGHEVLEAADGEAALALARSTDPDVLLLAREMPRLDGMAVLDALRGDPATADIPVVFVTGHTDAADLAEGLERGAHDYVRKPVDPIELVARVRSAIRLRALLRDLEALARTDVLTGLANRRHADDVLRASLAAATRHGRDVCVVLVDIDCFKAVNDVHGHAAGDAVLRTVASRLTDALREEDVAARWGGEEFLLVLPDAASAARVCERMREAVAAAPALTDDGTVVPVTASFGWAAWTGGESPEQ